MRIAIEAAVREYVDAADRDKAHGDLWQRIKNKAGSESFKKLCRLIRQLRKFPLDREAEALLHQVDGLDQILTRAEMRAVVYLPRTRRERFLSGLSLAWTGPGKGELSISEAGPFQRFMCSIVDRVPTRPLDGRGIKAFVKRERARRAALVVLNEVWSAEGRLIIDETKIT